MDWPKVITSIKAHGLTQTEIASEVGASVGHISDLLNGKRGKRIGHQLGERLLDLRDRLARKARKAA